MKASHVILLGLICVLLFKSSYAVGICQTDEICGYTDVNVAIPFLETDHSFATRLSLEKFEANSDLGFSLATVGGITFTSEEGVTINSEENIYLSSPVGGDIEVQGDLVQLEAGDLLSFWVANEAIIDVKEDMLLDIEFGTIDFTSHFGTRVSSVGGMILSSFVGDVRISAPEGTSNIRGDLVGVVAGGDNVNDIGVSIKSLDSMLLMANRELDLLSNESIEFESTSEFNLNSKFKNIEFEAGREISITAGSNIVSSAADVVQFESLLGDVSFDSNGSVSLYARNVQHRALDIVLNSEDTVYIEGTGRADFISEEDNVLTIDNGVLMAFEALRFIGTSDGDITFDLNSLLQSSSDLFVQAADLEDSAIQVIARNYHYQTQYADIVMMTSDAYLEAEVDIVYDLRDSFVLQAIKDEPYIPAGNFTDDAGLIYFDIGNTLKVASFGSVFINSDNQITLNDNNQIQILAGDNLFLGDMLKTTFIADDVTFTAANTINMVSNTDTFVTALEDLVVSGVGSLEIRTETTLIDANDDVIFFGGDVTIASLAGNTLYSIRDQITVDADNIGFIFDNDEPQTTYLEIESDIFIASGLLNLEAFTLTVEVTSGPSTFSSGNDLFFGAFEALFTSLTSSISFSNGFMDINAPTTVFRAGNEFLLQGFGGLDISSGFDIDFESGSAINFLSDTFNISSEDTVEFDAFDYISFFAEDDIDLSPTSGGDVVIEEGRVYFIADNDINISGAHSARLTSEDFNNIEFLSANLLISSTNGDISLLGQYFIQENFGDFDMNIDEDYVLSASTGDIVYETNILGELLSVTAAGPATYNGVYFTVESFSKDGNYDTSGDSLMVHATDIAIDGEGQIDIDVDGLISFNGDNMDVVMFLNNQFYPSTYSIGGNVMLTAGDEIRFETGSYTHSMDTLTVMPLAGSLVDFYAKSTSGEKLTVASATTQTFTFPETNIAGGRVDFRANNGDFVLTTDGLEITSMNGDNRFADTFDDKVHADGIITFTSGSRMNIVSNGYPNLPNSDDVRNGFEIDAHTGSLEFMAPAGSIEAYALRDSIQMNSQMDTTIMNTRDLIVNGGEGTVSVTTYGMLVGGTVPSTGIEFDAAIGDISIDSTMASVVMSSSLNQDIDSEFSSISFTARWNITHSASEHDGQLLYNALVGDLTFNIDENIMLTAGEPFYNADISMTASQNFEVLTQYEQRFLVTQPNTEESQDSIILTGDEGPIRFTTPGNQQIYASGVAHFEAQTDMLNVTAEQDINFGSANEISYISQFDVPVDVSDGSITVTANGGGGSVDFISDDSQAITATASDNIFVKSEDSNYIYSFTGFDFITNLDDVTFTQSGDYQNTHFHSGGSIVLQAFADDGIVFAGSRDYVAQAGRDILFDATENFSIGATSDEFSATEPTIAFNAGDDGTFSMVFDVLGGMSWTSNLRDLIYFRGQTISWAVSEDLTMDTNGDVLFSNSGNAGEASIEITTQDLLTLNGGEAVELTSVDDLNVNAEDNISLTSTGVQSTDISRILSRYNFIVNADTYRTTTNDLDGYVYDFFVDVEGEIVLTNTIGDGGTFTFDSDSTINAKTTAGPMDITSNGPMEFVTSGEFSPIIFASAGAANILSGETITAEGASIDIDAPSGITIQSNLDDVQFTASDYIEVDANRTLSFTSSDIININAGFNVDTGLNGFLNISSRGDLTMTSNDDLTFDALSNEAHITVIGDKAINITNSVPGSPIDQGDVLVDSANRYVISSGQDTYINAGRNILRDISDDIDYEVGHGITFDSNAAGASILLVSDSNFVSASNDISHSAMGDLIITASQDLEWFQINEHGFGGIYIASTGEGEDIDVTTTTTDEDIVFEAQAHVRSRSDAYISITTDDFDIESTNEGGDVVFFSTGNGGMEITSTTIDFDERPNTNSFVSINAKGAAGVSITADIVDFSSDEADIMFDVGSITFENPFTTADIDIFASGAVSFISSGSSDGDGFILECDADVTFDGDDFNLYAQRGKFTFTASEDYFITSNSGNIFTTAGDSIVIATGFTPQPNALEPERIGILIQGTSASSFKSIHHDVIMSTEDASWSLGSDFVIRAGSGVSFSAETEDIVMDTETLDLFGEDFLMDSANTDMDAGGILNLLARESIGIYADTLEFDASSITIQADTEILFTTPFGRVDFNSDTNDLLIPVLRKEGGVSGDGLANGDKYRTQEENQYPTCEERSFGFDIEAHAFCYCQWNKWRCRQADNL